MKKIIKTILLVIVVAVLVFLEYPTINKFLAKQFGLHLASEVISVEEVEKRLLK